MKNILNKISILVVTSALVFVFAHSANAYYTYVDHGDGYDTVYVDGVYQYTRQAPKNQVSQTTQTQTNYQNDYQANNTQPKKATVLASNTAKTTTVVKDTSTTTPENTTVDTSNENQNGNGLTALTLSGTNKFMPDTIFEWILVFVFMLIIIVLARQFRKKEHHQVTPTIAAHH